MPNPTKIDTMKKPSEVVVVSEDELDNDNSDGPLDFEKILKFEVGEFGPYQIFVGITMGFVSAFASFMVLNFLFISAVPDHRCFIPECEQANSNDFNAEWLKYAIPYKDGRLDPCSRYEYVPPLETNIDTCSAVNFNQTNVVRCDSFVIKNNEMNLASHLNMLCSGQEKKLALFGSASTIGRFIATPIFGFVADKIGRLHSIVVCGILGAIFSTLQALPSSLMTFELYWSLEFLAALFSTGMMGAGFIYNMEWVTGKYRVRLNNILLLVQTLVDYGCISLAAWYFADNFTAFKLVLATPASLVVFLYFFMGDSPKWLLTQNKFTQAIRSISIAGRMNGKPLQQHTIQQIEKLSAIAAKEKSNDQENVNRVSMTELLREKTLAFRLFIISLIWLFVLFAFFGILFGSTKVHSNKYISFMIIGLADVPGNLANTVLMNRLGRKATIGSALVIYGILLLTSTQVPKAGFYRLILFFFSKASITCALVGMFTYGSEFWPTSIRSTAFGIGKSVGRLGAIVASISVVLVEYHVNLPAILYASGAIFGSILLFACLPETMHCGKLPDTIEEAVAMGKRVKKRKLADKRLSVVELT